MGTENATTFATADSDWGGLWHVPFSFALAIDEQSSTAKDLRSLIRFDLGHERAEELGGLDYSDFGELRPVAFCRDLARGGKPQFFFELPCLVSFEDLRRKAVDSTSEFSGKIELISEGEDENYSPELACFLLLMVGPSDSEKSQIGQAH